MKRSKTSCCRIRCSHRSRSRVPRSEITEAHWFVRASMVVFIAATVDKTHPESNLTSENTYNTIVLFHEQYGFRLGVEKLIFFFAFIILMLFEIVLLSSLETSVTIGVGGEQCGARSAALSGLRRRSTTLYNYLSRGKGCAHGPPTFSEPILTYTVGYASRRKSPSVAGRRRVLP